jgi:hypothetical protein
LSDRPPALARESGHKKYFCFGPVSFKTWHLTLQELSGRPPALARESGHKKYFCFGSVSFKTWHLTLQELSGRPPPALDCESGQRKLSIRAGFFSNLELDPTGIERPATGAGPRTTTGNTSALGRFLLKPGT